MPGTRRTTCSRSGPTSTRACSTRATRRSATASSPGRRSSGCCPRTPSSRRSTRTASPASPDPTASPGRCSTRCVPGTRSATTSSGSSRAWPRCSPATSPTPTTRSGGCSTTSRTPASSTTRSSSSSPTTARAARAVRTARSTSGASSTASPTPTELTLPHIDELGTPAVLQPLQHRLGVGLRHAVPVLEAVGRLRGRRRRHVPVSRGRRGSPRQRHRAHQYVHAVDVVPTVYDLLGIEPPDVIKGYPQSPIEGESFAASLTDPAAPARRRSSTRCSGSARSTTRAGSPAPLHPPHVRLGQVRPGRVGALPPRRATARSPPTSPRRSPSGSSG